MKWVASTFSNVKSSSITSMFIIKGKPFVWLRISRWTVVM